MITVVTAFDDGLVVPAIVCLHSLCTSNADGDSIEVVVLHGGESLSESSRNRIADCVNAFSFAKVRFIDVGGAFADSFEIRGITIATYYRLMLPSILKNVDRVLYLDVDTVVRCSLRSVFDSNLGGAYIAGVRSVYGWLQADRVIRVGADPLEYVNAGFLVIDLAAMRRDNLEPDFLRIAERRLEYQDQDVLNIRCKGAIRHLHPRYNVHCMFDYEENVQTCDELYAGFNWRTLLDDPAVLHFAGIKPWESRDCWNCDFWWSTYNSCPLLTSDYYRIFQRRSLLARAALKGMDVRGHVPGGNGWFRRFAGLLIGSRRG